ncbi:MAG: hypothetical protein MUO67_01100 [Anaerolineales bacterium]|nr:hypothetical protein [Anaerolineales bacterium]
MVSDSHIFCLPTYGDCLPMVPSEAGATGLPLAFLLKFLNLGSRPRHLLIAHILNTPPKTWLISSACTPHRHLLRIFHLVGALHRNTLGYLPRACRFHSLHG